jgi:nucleotide-binding universal stress UspA family protein
MKVLAAVNLRDKEAERVVDGAATLAMRAGGTVDVLWVDDGKDQAFLRDAHLREAAKAAIGAQHEAALRALLTRISTPHRGQSLHGFGRAADTIGESAKGYDLVVLAGRPHSALDKALVGSVAQAVARTSPVPVLILPGGSRLPEVGEPLTAVFGVDLRASDAGISLDDVTRWANAVNAMVDVAHVDSAQLHIPYILDPEVRAGVQQEWATQREADLNALQDLLVRMPAHVAGSPRLADGDPAEGLAEIADDYHVVVVATHGRTGLARWWIGSVAEKLLALSKVPVLLLRAE